MNTNATIEVQDLTKWFPVGRGIRRSLLKQEYVRAVDGISFTINRKENLGLVGESGCGKSTTALLMAGLLEPTEGDIYFEGISTALLKRKDRRKLCREMQIVFQNPYGCLNPRWSIFDLLAEPLVIHKICDDRASRVERVRAMLETVELTPSEEFIERFPHELSGGQRQRIAIGRALMLQPRFLIADEPVSMLDVSSRGGILRLLLKLREKLSLSMLFITHDLAVARHVSDRIAVMYLGKMVEIAESRRVVEEPMHPYTQALISAIPSPDPIARGVKVMVKGEVPGAMHRLSGCRFHPRCPYSFDVCLKREPEFVEISPEHYVACHKWN